MPVSVSDLLKLRAGTKALGAAIPTHRSMSGLNETELRSYRDAVVAAARKVTDAITDGITEERANELEQLHETGMALLDDIDATVEMRGRRPTAPATAPAPGTYGYGMAESRSGWVDTDGRPVRVLAPNERLGEERGAGVGVGDIMRAMVKGPRNEREERALAEGNGASGGYTVPAPLASYFIDRLRANSVCIKAGARTVDLTSSSLAIARLDTDPVASWAQENALIPASDMTFSRVLFTAKKLTTLVKVSRELLEDSINVGDAIDAAFAGAMALELDRVGLFGTGVDPQPLGIANTPGINVIALNGSANGDYPANYDPLVDAMYAIVANNAGPASAAVYNPRTWQTFAKLKDGQGNPLRVPDDVASLPKLTTTAMPMDKTVGTSTDCSSIITGNFAHMMIGVRKQMEIIRADQPFIGNDQIAFLARLRADIQLAHPGAFTHTTGIRAK